MMNGYPSQPQLKRLPSHWRAGSRQVFLVAMLLVGNASTLWAIEKIELSQEGKNIVLSGRVLVEGQDGSLLFQSRDGVIHVISKEEVKQRSSESRPFEPLSQDAFGRQLLDSLPGGFQLQTTDHFVIGYNTSEAYARWCGNLLERLYRAFFAFWEKREFELKPPEFPLAVLIFEDQADYVAYSRSELGAAAEAVIGYYNFRTNQMVMFDLTGLAQANRTQRRRYSSSQIRQLLSQPASERNVATMIHEATHQLAYNTGLQTRYAGNPFWVAEGLAVYFESPDLRNTTGWRTIGRVNRFRLQEFTRQLPTRSPNRLAQLLADDALFRNSGTASAAYADAWGLNYYLFRKKPKDYVAYLTELSKMSPLQAPSAEDRLEQFRRFFGSDLERLDKDMTAYLRRIR